MSADVFHEGDTVEIEGLGTRTIGKVVVGKNVETREKKLGGVTGKGFMPGESGNPSGRPKKAVISQIYEKILADPENQAAIEQSVLKMLLGGRMSGQLQLKEMAERTEGKIAQAHKIDGDITISTLSERLKKARELVGE